MLLALLSFLEFPPFFLMLVTFYPRHKEKLRKWAAGIPNRPHPPESDHSSVTWGFLKFPPRLWGCSWHWCVSWLLSTVLVVSLGWPRPGSGRGPGLSDVITSFIDGRHSRICVAPPRSSHTLTATLNPTDPPTLPSPLLSIGHSTGHIHTHTHTHRHTRRERETVHTQATVVCFVSLTASAQAGLNETLVQREAAIMSKIKMGVVLGLIVRF